MRFPSTFAMLAWAAVATAVKCPIKMNLTGHIDPDQVMTFVYQPFEVPAGVASISALYSYSQKGQGNALDIGIFDQRGYEMMDAHNGTSGSRGWSGGFRDNFTISATWATPGYNAGPIVPGTWNIVFGPYSSTTEGIDWQLSIEMRFGASDEWFSPAYTTVSLDPVPYFADEQRWLRGDFHLHTVYSDGQYLPEEQIANAIDRKLDFMFFSEHNTDSGIEIYGVYQPENLLIGRAIEVTTRHGHWNALGLDRGQIIEWRYHPGDEAGYPAAAEQVHRAGGLVSINHPFTACDRCDWTLDWDNHDAIEVWNGPWDATDQLAVEKWQEFLVEGRRYTAIGGSDAHRSPDVTALPTTVVLSRGWNQAAIIDGARKGFAYMVKEPDMTMALTIDGGGITYHMGQTVKADSVAGKKAKLSLVGFGGNVASWVSDKGYVSNTTVEADGTLEVAVQGMKFLRAEVRDDSGNALGLTNPIYFS